MSRSKRLQPVLRAVGHDERECAARLAEAERRTLEAERRLGEIEGYQSDYEKGLTGRVAAGASAGSLRDYRAFLARLGEARRAQGRAVVQAKAAERAARDAWRSAAQRAKALGHVVGRWQAEERSASERRDQRETDERALQMSRLRERQP